MVVKLIHGYGIGLVGMSWTGPAPGGRPVRRPRHARRGATRPCPARRSSGPPPGAAPSTSQGSDARIRPAPPQGTGTPPGSECTSRPLPKAGRGVRREVPLHKVRGGFGPVVRPCGAPEPAPRHARNPGLGHQPRNPLAARRLPLRLQILQNARRAVHPVRLAVQFDDPPRQLRPCMSRRGRAKPLQF